jgi:ribosome biogenesis protein BRX1
MSGKIYEKHKGDQGAKLAAHMPSRDDEVLSSSSDDEEPQVRARVTKASKRDLRKYVNKQRTLVFSSRGVTHRDRYLMSDIRDLLPHSKKDVKLDVKSKLFVVNEVCEMKNCNNCIFFEARKHQDLYMWMAKTPNGPSIKFLVENVHTMSELKLTGNMLKGSRPILCFDANFDTQPHFKLMKEMLTQVWGSPKGHPKVKPFVDHMLSFFIADDRIWFRNYQLVRKDPEDPKAGNVLVEIGPRFCLNPIRVFSGSFGGSTLWTNNTYESPNEVRARLRKGKHDMVKKRNDQRIKRKKHKQNMKMPEDPLDSVF